MPHPWVYSATITGDTVTFRVEVTDLYAALKDSPGAIEISGEATQVNGSLAPISRIASMADASAGAADDEDEAGRWFVNVEADPVPGHSFDPNEDVTVFVRLAQAWVTVLGRGTDDTSTNTTTTTGTEAPPGPTWGVHRADAHINVPVLHK